MLQSETKDIMKTETDYWQEPGSDKLRISTASNIYYVSLKEIVRIQSISNYSKLFFRSGQTLTVSKGLSYFDELLTNSHFSRIHRTHLVNLLYVNRYMQGTAPRLGLSNDEMLPVARRKKKNLQEKMMSFSR